MAKDIYEFRGGGPKDGHIESLAPNEFLWGIPSGPEIGLYRREVLRGREIMQWCPRERLDKWIPDIRFDRSS